MGSASMVFVNPGVIALLIAIILLAFTVACIVFAGVVKGLCGLFPCWRGWSFHQGVNSVGPPRPQGSGKTRR